MLKLKTMPEETPAMLQYHKIKRKHPDCIVLFQLGDFYEALYEDAKTVSSILDIVLTARNKRGKKIPMAGIPVHALDTYLPKLVNAGLKVAIVAQTEEPTKGKKIVDRDVIRIVTPGTLSEDIVLKSKTYRYIAAISSVQKGEANAYAIAYADLSTGTFKATKEITREYGKDLLQSLQPNEILIPEQLTDQFIEELKKKYITTPLDPYFFDVDLSFSALIDHFHTATLKGFSIEKSDRLTISVAGALLQYLKNTQRTSLEHINKISIHSSKNGMTIDATTLRNLEIIYPLFSKDGPSLLSTIDRTKTSMGGRIIKDWLLNPLADVKKIRNRNETVEFFLKNIKELESLDGYLTQISDIERIVGKFGLNSLKPPHLVSLKESMKNVENVIVALKKTGDPLTQKTTLINRMIKKTEKNLERVRPLVEEIDKAIEENPPSVTHMGGIIKRGYCEELDRIREAAEKGKNWIKSLEQTERKRTNISSLKVRYNKIFGYYIEVSKPNLSKVPKDYIRKQTLVNAERFITTELKEVEAKVLGAEERMIKLEEELFNRLVEKCKSNVSSLQKVARAIGVIDVLWGLAKLAHEKNYVKPQITEEDEIYIKNGRHPVVEDIAEKTGESFVPNDTKIGGNHAQIIILTGPNMSGKSTYIRQIALITLLAQIGSFVPAQKAKIGIVDKIFARVGASDNLAFGESTFMVEMLEAANILNHATKKSLVILDEVGRGTSTYDGMSLAWAIVEYIKQKIGCKTLFATHYHELTDLAYILDGIKNYQVVARDDGEKVIFTRKVIPGKADKSYGIHIAKLAGVPQAVVKRAWNILEKFENGKKKGIQLTLPLSFSPPAKNKENEIENKIREIEIENITPIEALNFLAKLKKMLDK